MPQTYVFQSQQKISVVKINYWVGNLLVIFLTYMLNKVIYVKYLISKFLVILPWLSFLHFFMFHYYPYQKEAKI